MTKILILLPQQDFDPTEVAVPWKAWTDAGCHLTFASELGTAANCDWITLMGEELPFWAKSLVAKPENASLYVEMVHSEAFQHPVKWSDVRVSDYGHFHFPGGHAPGMRPYCESSEVQRIAKEAFAADLPVSAICHGVLPLARAGVLKGRKTTALTTTMERFAIALTNGRLGDHYRTYSETVESEVKRMLAKPSDFDTGPLIPRFATKSNPEIGFAVRDGNYVSARFPGDAWTMATEVLRLLL
ncbi:MAG: type 1 glutamine amidotransferase domain-containing protein [Sphingorhabdus sp.]